MSVRVRSFGMVFGLAGAAACALILGITAAIGLASQELLLLPTFILAGLLGALVTSREPANPVGWLMCAASAGAVLFYLPVDYGYVAGVTVHGGWPGGGVALWLGAWVWIPVVAVFLPMLTVRFPDGKVPPRWRVVDWLAIVGSALAILGVALAPPDVLVRFMLLPQSRLALAAALVENPLGSLAPAPLAAALQYGGLALIPLAYVAALASVVGRFRGAHGEQRLQLKWFAYACSVIAASVVFGVVVEIAGLGASGVTGAAYHLLFMALPLGIGIAILRYRLYDIDVIINRTVVYVSLTAILGALYTAIVTFLNRLFISISGQKSDTAYVLTAFLVVVAFSPLKDWLQRQVDRRVGGATASAALDRFTAGVEAVVSVMDVHRVACRLVDQAVAAFDARGAALYLHSMDDAEPLYSRGHVNADAGIEVALLHEGVRYGRLVMASRRGGVAYSQNDRDALQRSADSVSEALALAAHLGHHPLSGRQMEGGIE